jgi:periplasmic copper chaperone A
MHRVSWRLRAAAPAAILLVIGTVPALAAQKAVSAAEAWIRLPSAGETTASGFAVIDNPTMYDVYLVDASSEAAAEVLFATTTSAGDTPVKEVTAPAYGKVELTPTGVHLVLKGLKQPLKNGESVPVTVRTDGGAVIAFTAVVREK